MYTNHLLYCTLNIYCLIHVIILSLLIALKYMCSIEPARVEKNRSETGGKRKEILHSSQKMFFFLLLVINTNSIDVYSIAYLYFFFHSCLNMFTSDMYRMIYRNNALNISKHAALRLPPFIP